MSPLGKGIGCYGLDVKYLPKEKNYLPKAHVFGLLDPSCIL